LRLDRNALTELSSGALEGSYSTENFYLSYNQLDHRRLDEELFLPFDDLAVLDMTGNPNMECDKFNLPGQDISICIEEPAPETTRQRLLDPEDNLVLEQSENTCCFIFGPPSPCTTELLHGGLIGTVIELGDLSTLENRPDDYAFHFTVVPRSGPAVVTAIQFSSGERRSTAGWRDPVEFTLYGAPETTGQYNYTQIATRAIDPFTSIATRPRLCSHSSTPTSTHHFV
jgi:hypothetical protein